MRSRSPRLPHVFMSSSSSHHRSSKKQQSITTILLITSQRLEYESRRAEDADRKAAEALSRLRTVLDEKERTDQHIARITEELRLYKIQLDLAQKEIDRAQEIVDQVEKARIDADADAARARTVARKFQEDWVVMNAREEGRKQGYNEGLRKGRRAGFEEGRATGYAHGHRRANYLDHQRSVPSPPRILRTVSTHSDRSRRARVQSPPRAIPDAAPFARALPVPTLTTPTPSFRQPVPLSVLSPSDSPEPIHPRPHSPASTDGWIPTADENLNMDIPPPHALTNPIIAGTAMSPRSTTRSIPPQPQIRSRDYAYPSTSSHHVVFATQPPPRSPTAASTHLSDLELVSSPRHGSIKSVRSTSSAHDNTKPSPSHSSSSPAREPSLPERIAEEWRMANPDIASSPQRNGDQETNLKEGVVIPSPVIVAQRVEMYNNAPLANKPFDKPPTSPTLGALIQNKNNDNKTNLSRGLSNTSSTVQIHVSSPSTSPSDISLSARLAKDLLSPHYQPQPLPTAAATTTTSPTEPSTETKKTAPTPSPRYEEAPLPPGITYPDPPVGKNKKKKKKKEKQQQQQQDGLSGSPAPLDRPISLFSEPIE